MPSTWSCATYLHIITKINLKMIWNCDNCSKVSWSFQGAAQWPWHPPQAPSGARTAEWTPETLQRPPRRRACASRWHPPEPPWPSGEWLKTGVSDTVYPYLYHRVSVLRSWNTWRIMKHNTTGWNDFCRAARVCPKEIPTPDVIAIRAIAWGRSFQSCCSKWRT